MQEFMLPCRHRWTAPPPRGALCLFSINRSEQLTQADTEPLGEARYHVECWIGPPRSILE